MKRSLVILWSEEAEGSRSLLSKAQHLDRKQINGKTMWVNGFFQETGNTDVGELDIDSGTWPRKYFLILS